MFDPEFFPTPESVVHKMLEGFKLCRSGPGCVYGVLEPSAGKGNILDVIKGLGTSYGGYNGPKLWAIEQNPELVGLLQSKGYKVVGKDFLSFRPENRIDLIVMNPPFSVGAKHLLHAWDILEGGHIACLLNAETIRNPYSEERRLLASVIGSFGSVEFLGPVFKSSERSTDVEVALVRLHKEREEGAGIRFEAPKGQEERPDFAKIETSTDLMKPDLVGALIRQYEKAKESYADLLKAQAGVSFYLSGICALSDVLGDEGGRGGHVFDMSLDSRYDDFTDALRLKFWTHILGVLGIDKLLTHKLRSTFREFIEQQGSMALTKENIADVLGMLLLNSDNILKQSVVAVFDLFTKYHKENRTHIEGWKTNERWKVGRKIILPNYVRYEFGKFGNAYGRYSEYSDIDKALCYLSGKRLEDILTIEKAIKPHENTSESEFFTMRYFQKGTLHLTFKDESLWARFNQVACDGRNWLGGGHD